MIYIHPFAILVQIFDALNLKFSLSTHLLYRLFFQRNLIIINNFIINIFPSMLWIHFLYYQLILKGILLNSLGPYFHSLLPWNLIIIKHSHFLTLQFSRVIDSNYCPLDIIIKAISYLLLLHQVIFLTYA